MLDGKSAIFVSLGARRWLEAVILLGGSGHALFKVKVVVFEHCWKGYI